MFKKTKSVGGQEVAKAHFAWAPTDDPADWKLPLHNCNHVQDALARFDQTQDIPDDKKHGVAETIVAKAKDCGFDTSGFEKEYLRSLSPAVRAIRARLGDREVRYLTGRIELRASDKGPRLRMTVPYNSESDDLGGFREQVRPGAFTKSMQERDVMSLWNHDPMWVLGRKGNDTLNLESTGEGLTGEVQLDKDDPMHQHFARRVERRDVTGTSFGFQKVHDDWGGVASDGIPLRSLQEVRLYDLSPVTFPAYPESGVTSRSLVDVASVRAGVDLATLVAAIVGSDGGKIRHDLAAGVRSQVDRILAMLPPPPAPVRSDDDRRRVLRLAEILASA